MKFTAVLCCLLLVCGQAFAEAPVRVAPSPAPVAKTATPAPVEQKSKTKELLKDAAIVAAVIAASIALYKAQSGGPCACPNDVDRAGHKCGKRSAHDRAGGYSVTCFAHEVTAEMVSAYRGANGY